MFRKLAIFLALFLVIVGCRDKGFNLRITFDHIQGLKEDNGVFFGRNHIDRVTGTYHAKGDCYTVHVEIRREFAKAATEYARFFIVADPGDKNKKAIEMVQIKGGGAPLKNEATVSGSGRCSVLLGQTLHTLKKGLDDLKRQFEELSDQFMGIPESEAYKKLEKELRRFSEEIKRSGAAALERIEKEVLPRLKGELERLRERLLRLKKQEGADTLLEA